MPDPVSLIATGSKVTRNTFDTVVRLDEHIAHIHVVADTWFQYSVLPADLPRVVEAARATGVKLERLTASHDGRKKTETREVLVEGKQR